jgi:hypothetical protein
LRHGLATKAQLQQVVADCAGWPYLRRAKRALGVADVGTESVAESLTRAVLAEAGLPTPLLQVDIADERGTSVGRVDFLFEAQRTILETDGRVKYDDPGSLWREKRREDALRELGYEVVRVTWAQLMGPAESVRRRILDAFARAARRARRRHSAELSFTRGARRVEGSCGE